MIRVMCKAFVFLLLMTLPGIKELKAEGPDTVHVGIYITSVHDIDFRLKEYTVNFWLWLTYKNPDFNFMQNLEVPQAKSIVKSYAITDSSGERISTLMKVQCVMKDSWKIDNFPFDRQRLRLSIENAQFDSRYLIFIADTLGKHYDKKFTISGWNIDSFEISTGIKAYETSFGDLTLDKPHSEYGSFKVKIGIKRDPWGLFLKIFLGMYVSFLIAYSCFYIHSDHSDSRFGLSVGSLFAAIGNKYVIDSSLPETFTLVDSLHSLTMLFILSVIAFSIHSLTLLKKGELEKANRNDMMGAQILLLIYLSLNLYFIFTAALS